MRLRRIFAILLSAVMVVGAVPAEAWAEAVAEAPAGAASIQMRINAQDDEAWTSFLSRDEAEERVADVAARTEALHVELRAAAEGQVTLAVKALVSSADADGWAWEEHAEAAEVELEGPVAGLALTLGGEQASAYALWYRVHGAEQGWSAWACDGEPAVLDTPCAADDVQVVLEPQDEAAPAESDVQEQPVAEQPAAEQPAAEQADPAEPAETDAAPADAAPAEQPAASVETAAPAPADAALVAQALPKAPTVTYQAHVQRQGWQKSVTNAALAGTTGKALRVEALRISLPAGTNGGITYQSHVQSKGWLDWVKDGAQTGTTGSAKRIEALKIQLYGAVSQTFDVWYRAHVQSIGWQDWVKNGAEAGTTGLSKRVEAVQVILMPKGADAPSAASTAAVEGADHATRASLTYRLNTVGTGWQGWVADGDTAGSTGLAAPANALAAQVVGLTASELSYSTYLDGAWQAQAAAGAVSGKPSGRKPLEAIKMSLSGKAAQLYDVYYRVYAGGWTGWAKNGSPAGSVGFSKGIEAVEARLVARGGAAPGSTAQAFSERPVLRYRAHVQSDGWKGWVGEGETAGTSGRGLRLEALQTSVSSSQFSGQIQVRPYVQGKGWLNYTSGNNAVAGTSGSGLRVEAFQIRLTDQLASSFDVYYRVHARTFGWLGWAKNGASVGSTGLSLRLEAVQIKLVSKGGAAPGSTTRPFVDSSTVTKLGYQNRAGFYQVSRKNVTITSAARAPWNYITPSRIGLWATRQQCVDAFLQRAREYLGTGYVWDYACAPGVGVDCIGLVYQCAYACGMDLGGGTGYNDFNPWAHWITGASGWHSHDANNFWSYGKAMHVSVAARRPGDVLYYPGHVSIYVGNNTVIEAYPGTGVSYASMSAHGGPAGCIRLFQ